MANEHEGYIWVQDAAKKYGVSRQYLDNQVRFGKLKQYKWPAETRVYLQVAELDKFFSGPMEQQRGQDAG